MEKEELHSCYFEAIGRFKLLKQIFHSNAGLCDFVEAELDDNEVAESYMETIQQNYRYAELLVDSFHKISQDQLDERFNLRLLLDEVVGRAMNISSSTITCDCDEDREYLVKSTSDGLLDAMMSVICTIVGLEGNVTIKVSELLVDDSQINLRKAKLPLGAYWQVQILPTNFDSDDYQPLFHYKKHLEGFLKNNDFVRAYGAIVAHNGDLFMASNTNDCALSILLPAIDSPYVKGALEDQDDQLHGTETLLVVDDEDMIWDILIDALQELGYTVLLAEDGVDAIEIYRENPGMIDAVILDMVMPRMNGREAFYKLKELDEDVRVILSSGFMAEGDAGDIIKDGARGFLRKPYRINDLAKLIRQALV